MSKTATGRTRLPTEGGGGGDASHAAGIPEDIALLRRELGQLHAEFASVAADLRRLDSPDMHDVRIRLEHRQDELRSRIRRLREEIDACSDE